MRVPSRRHGPVRSGRSRTRLRGRLPGSQLLRAQARVIGAGPSREVRAKRRRAAQAVPTRGRRKNRRGRDRFAQGQCGFWLVRRGARCEGAGRRARPPRPRSGKRLAVLPVWIDLAAAAPWPRIRETGLGSARGLRRSTAVRRRAAVAASHGQRRGDGRAPIFSRHCFRNGRSPFPIRGLTRTSRPSFYRADIEFSIGGIN